VPIIKARPAMRTQPRIPNTLGELVMMVVMPMKAPITMTALAAGSVASSNLSSVGEARGNGGGGGGLRIRSVLLIY
jgi:hypothetical protein